MNDPTWTEVAMVALIIIAILGALLIGGWLGGRE